MFLKKKLFNNTKTAIILPNGKHISYFELERYAEKIYDKINNRCLVFCLSSNDIGSMCGYLSFMTNKVVPLLLDISIQKSFLKSLIKVYKPKYLWIPNNRVNEIEFVEKLISLFNYTLLKVEQNSNYIINDNLALLLTTSGSSGSPKLVRLSYENINSNAASISKYLSINENERPITTLPMSYSFGLSIIHSHILASSTILLTNHSLMEKEFWNHLVRYKATSLSGVPYTFEMLKKLKFFNLKLPHLKTLTQAGGRLEDDLSKQFANYCHKSGKLFYIMYGQTEASPRMSYLPPEFSISKIGSIGTTIPGGEFYLIDDSGKKIIKNNTTGELVYKGPNVAMGYALNIEDIAKNDQNNGLLFTGDMAERDTDGFYYISGRKKRFIKIYGNRISLDQLETLLKNITLEVACSGGDDSLIVFITDIKYFKRIKIFIHEKIKINYNSFRIKIIDTIPINSSGKIIYHQLPL